MFVYAFVKPIVCMRLNNKIIIIIITIYTRSNILCPPKMFGLICRNVFGRLPGTILHVGK
jgi:hypothetical protein